MAADTPSLPPAAPAGPGPIAQHWSVRLRDFIYTYLPLLLMMVLAATTWWLVRVTPLPPVGSLQEPSPQAPDYTLTGVDLQRYRGDGTLLARIQGRVLRHFPQGDRMVLEEARIVWSQADGPLTATARLAEVTQGGDRARLSGSVVLQRPAGADRPAVEVRGEEIEVDARAARAWSVRPVEWIDGDSVIRAAGFEYDQEPGVVQLQGPVSALWRATNARGR